MSMQRRTLVTGLAAAPLALRLGRARAMPPAPRIRIGTGDVTGLGYAFGSAIKRLLSGYPPTGAYATTVFGTAGDVENLRGLASGRFELAVVQAGLARRAAGGIGHGWSRAPLTDLRVLLGAVPEIFLVLARAGSGVERIADLRGRPTYLGEVDSGTRPIAEVVIEASGLPLPALGPIIDMPLAAVGAALCDQTIDAAAFVSGNPTLPIAQALAACDLHPVTVEPAVMASVMADRPALHPATLPAGTYPQITRPVDAIGLRGLVLTTSSLPDAVAAGITAAVIENVAELRRLHQAFARITVADLTAGCTELPLHSGAARWLRRRGLLPRGCSVA